MTTSNQVVASEDGVTQVHIARDENGKIVALRVWEVTEFPAPTTALPPAFSSLSGSDGTTSAIDISAYDGLGSVRGNG